MSATAQAIAPFVIPDRNEKIRNKILLRSPACFVLLTFVHASMFNQRTPSPGTCVMTFCSQLPEPRFYAQLIFRLEFEMERISSNAYCLLGRDLPRIDDGEDENGPQPIGFDFRRHLQCRGLRAVPARKAAIEIPTANYLATNSKSAC